MNFPLKTQRLAVVALLLLWCTLLITLRIERTGNLGLTFLWWNLLLAFVPLLAATAFDSAYRRNQNIGQIIWFLVWLLFLPNAPYILTDLIHLRPHEFVPLWYDLIVLMSSAGTGLFLGYISLMDVQLIVEQRFGKASGWSVAIGSLLLSGFGIYIGRFLRWNSWDIINNPLGLLSHLLEVVFSLDARPNPLVVTLVFGIALSLGYVALRVMGTSVETVTKNRTCQ